MKTKRRKFGIGLKIASLLTTLAVVSVGLASWIITVPTQSAPVNGTIKVDTVSTSQITLTGEWINVKEENSTITLTGATKGSNSQMYYGAPETTIENAWLTNGDTKKENLVAWLKVTATTSNATLSSLTVKFEATNVSKFEGAIGASIGAPEFTVWKETKTTTPAEGEGETVSYTYAKVGNTETYNKDAKATVEEQQVDADYLQISLSGSNTNVYYIKVEFKWGSDFGNRNAYTYFNELEYSPELASEATTKLTNLYDALNGVSYKMTIDADYA